MGYQASTSSTQLNSIIVSGGVLGMVEVVLIVISVVGLSSFIGKVGHTEATYL